MWTRDSEQIPLEMVSHHLCPAGPVAWGEGLSNTVITRVEKTRRWMAGSLNDLQFCCWWLNTLPQPVNEQCWSNEAEEGEELLEVRGKGWGGGVEVANVLEYTHTDGNGKIFISENVCPYLCIKKSCIGCIWLWTHSFLFWWFPVLCFSFHSCWYSDIIICSSFANFFPCS